MQDVLGYAGRKVVVTGAASGMGEAAASLLSRLGAEVHALDVKPVKADVAQALGSDLAKKDSMGWRKNLDAVRALVETADFDAGRAWCEAHPEQASGYLFSKQCIIYYTKKRAGELVSRRIRMNCLSPAPTATPMLPTFHQQAGREMIDEHFRAPIGRDATSEEMAEPLVFLNSRMARFVSGQNLFVDFAYEAQIDAGMRPALL